LDTFKICGKHHLYHPRNTFYLFGGSYPVEVVLPEVHASYLVNRKVIQLEYSESP
jgi:hypothetical protein